MLPRALRVGQKPLGLAEGLIGNIWGGPGRHLPTAGVCNQHIGVSYRLWPTARVCYQHVGMLVLNAFWAICGVVLLDISPPQLNAASVLACS